MCKHYLKVSQIFTHDRQWEMPAWMALYRRKWRYNKVEQLITKSGNVKEIWLFWKLHMSQIVHFTLESMRVSFYCKVNRKIHKTSACQFFFASDCNSTFSGSCFCTTTLRAVFWNIFFRRRTVTDTLLYLHRKFLSFVRIWEVLWTIKIADKSSVYFFIENILI